RQDHRGHRQWCRDLRVLHQRVVEARAEWERPALRALVPRRRAGARRLLSGAMTPVDVAAFAAHWQAARPAIVVVVTACAVMVAALVRRPGNRTLLAGIGILGLAATTWVAVAAWRGGDDPSGFQHMLRADRYGLFFTIVICLSAALTLLMSVDFVHEWGLP